MTEELYPEHIQVHKVKLPEGEWKTVQDMDDVNIWLRFNIVLQGNAENIAEKGMAGDGTRQLRILTQECVRRKMFERRIEFHEKDGSLSDGLLLTWYEILKQLLEGERKGTWETEGDTNREYTLVVKKLIERGVQMEQRAVGLKPLRVDGRLIT